MRLPQVCFLLDVKKSVLGDVPEVGGSGHGDRELLPILSGAVGVDPLHVVANVIFLVIFL